MSLENRINAFIELGNFLTQFKSEKKKQSLNLLNDKYYNDFEGLIAKQKSLNGWFTEENVLQAVDAVGHSLSEEEIKKWLNNYELREKPKRIGVIMAGNIPMVGFHDLLCVLITGNTLVAKLSSDDNTLIRMIAKILISLDSYFEDKIYFKEKLEGFDAVIATGSNNTARYFEYYFAKYPHIIRKNRNSVAIIHENDTKKELLKLGRDIFQYFGLGCRNVSKIYFPKGYKIDHFFQAIYEDYQYVVENNKYANNYDYNRAVYLMGNNELLDNGFLLLKEEKQFASPVGVIHYEFYESIATLTQEMEEKVEEIQCVVSSNHIPIASLPFGETQSPKLSDYADGVDTIDFLMNLN